jgi:hypothetical protein
MITEFGSILNKRLEKCGCKINSEDMLNDILTLDVRTSDNAKVAVILVDSRTNLLCAMFLDEFMIYFVDLADPKFDPELLVADCSAVAKVTRKVRYYGDLYKEFEKRQLKMPTETLPGVLSKLLQAF